MSYQVRIEGAALIRLNGLPAQAFDAPVERMVDLVDEPWDASAMTRGDDAAVRMTIFDAGNGLLSFHADDGAELIRIFRHHLDRLSFCRHGYQVRPVRARDCKKQAKNSVDLPTRGQSQSVLVMPRLLRRRKIGYDPHGRRDAG